MAPDKGPKIYVSESLVSKYPFSTHDSNGVAQTKDAQVPIDFFTGLKGFTDALKVERDGWNIKTNLVVAELRAGIVQGEQVSFRVLNVFPDNDISRGQSGYDGNYAIFRSGLAYHEKLDKIGAITGEQAAGSKNSFLSFLGMQILTENEQRQKEGEREIQTKATRVFEEILTKYDGVDADNDAAVDEFITQNLQSSDAANLARTLAMGYFHSEQALLAYLWNDAKQCVDNPGTCKFAGALATILGSQSVCDVQLLVLDLVSIPNTVCTNCVTGLTQAIFADSYENYIKSLRNAQTGEGCGNDYRLNLLVRARAYKVFRGGPKGENMPSNGVLPSNHRILIHQMLEDKPKTDAGAKDSPEPMAGAS